jgi:hypothetical protein
VLESLAIGSLTQSSRVQLDFDPQSDSKGCEMTAITLFLKMAFYLRFTYVRPSIGPDVHRLRRGAHVPAI